jgi:hypothetical protein
VALAAIQGLAQVVEQKDDDIAALEARVSVLEQQNADMQAQLEALKTRVGSTQPPANPWPTWSVVGLTLVGLAVGLVAIRRGGGQ